MANVQYNVGTFTGLNGIATIYNAKTAGGTEFLVYKVLEAAEEFWRFMSRTAMQSYLASNVATISSNIDLTKMPDVAPDGVLDEDLNAIIENGAGLPRLYSSQAFYSLKGTGVAEFTGDKGTITSGAKTSSTVVVTSNAKTMSEYVTDITAWATKNWILVLVALFLLLEFLGVTHFLGLNKKKKAVRRRR